MNILNIFYQNEKVITVQGVNRLIYYFKKLPGIGKLLSDTAYCSPTLKKVLTILILIFRIVYISICKGAYLASLSIPVLLVHHTINEVASKGAMLVVLFFIVSGIGGPFFSNDTINPRKDAYVMIRLMRLDPKVYVYVRWLRHYVIDIIFIFIGFIGVSNMLDMPMETALFLTMYYLGAHLIGELWFMYQAQFKKRFLTNNIMYMSIGSITCMLIGYGSLFLPMQLDRVMNYLLYGVPIVVLAVGLLAFRYIMKHMDFSYLMNEALVRNHNVIDYKSTVRNTRFKDVELKDKDFNTKELQKKRYDKLQGYAYLNALFFQRHKRLMYRPMRFRIIFIALTTVSFLALAFLFDFNAKTNNYGMPDLNMMKLVPLFTFVMYFSSIGEKITRAMFYNCDISLLRYGYYREANAILTNFRIRLRKVSLYNILIALFICCSVLILNFVGNFQFTLQDMGLSMLAILCLAFFFSIHHLFLYYVLQPYTGELDMRNPLFNIVNGVVYILCYIGYQIPGNIYYVCGVLMITIVYSITAIILVYKLAPKTFRIR